MGCIGFYLKLLSHAKWANHYYKIRLPSHRINQIPIAHKLGITIPPTLVTHSYEAACNFVTEQGKCMIKSMCYSGFLHDEKEYACYTCPIDVETLLAFRDSIRLAPVFLQKQIQKKAQYRVTLIGKHDFVYRIDAEHTNDSDVTLDGRVAEPDKLVHVPD